MNFLKRNFLLFVVFLTGASVLVIEVSASRILVPFYGSTIFTMSSILTIILAALSLGYYVGGKLADKKPSKLLFFFIIFLSGCTLLFLHAFGLVLLPALSTTLSGNTGPLIFSLFLFFIPSALLGALSPFVIKLQSKSFPGRGVGSLSGQIFFWSTVGSITGSLLTGFVLIPRFGVNEIVVSNSLLLFSLGLVPIAFLDKQKKYIYKIIVPAFIFVVFIIFVNKVESVWKKMFIFKEDSVYQNISVVKTKWKDKRDVYGLMFSGDGIESAVYLDEKDPTDLVFDYTKYYKLYKILNPKIKNALVIGGGTYTVPRALAYELPQAQVDVCEIDAKLEEIAKKYFFLKDDNRLNLNIEDGRHFLQTTDKKYDFIFLDAYNASLSVPSHLATKEFFDLVRNHLNKNGVVVMNVIADLSRQRDSFLFSEIKTFRSVFSNSYFFTTKSRGKIDVQNIMFVALNSNKKFNFKSTKFDLSTDNFLKQLSQKQINMERFNFDKDIIFSDNYVPVDYMNRNMTLNSKKRDKKREKEMMAIVTEQLEYNPRYLGTKGHKRVQEIIQAEMDDLTDEVIVQKWTHVTKDGSKYELKNIIGKLNPDKKDRILLAAHYDSKKFAHMDKKHPNSFMPGANDSGSGVAVLFDVARELLLKKDKLDIGVDFVFFDGEEGEPGISGDFSNYENLGSKYFAKNIKNIYKNGEKVSGIVLDMVADKDFQILKEPKSEKNSKEYMDKFWEIGKTIDVNVFSDESYGEIVDDHIALNEADIPTFLVIDMNYKYWHTTKDTLDKCSGKSMRIISDVVTSYVKKFSKNFKDKKTSKK